MLMSEVPLKCLFCRRRGFLGGGAEQQVQGWAQNSAATLKAWTPDMSVGVASPLARGQKAWTPVGGGAGISSPLAGPSRQRRFPDQEGVAPLMSGL